MLVWDKTKLVKVRKLREEGRPDSLSRIQHIVEAPKMTRLEQQENTATHDSNLDRGGAFIKLQECSSSVHVKKENKRIRALII